MCGLTYQHFWENFKQCCLSMPTYLKKKGSEWWNYEFEKKATMKDGNWNFEVSFFLLPTELILWSIYKIIKCSHILVTSSLCEKCPNREFFLVRIFLYSEWVRSKSLYSVQMQESTNQEILRIWTLLTQCLG